LLYNSLLVCGFNAPVKGLMRITLTADETRRAVSRRNSGKTKRTGITTIDYPHVQVWWNSVRRM